jgi:phage shock protein A
MNFFSRVWGYLKTAITGGVEKRMDPGIQIEQAVQEAQKRDRELREQAARVIAHRTEVQMKLDRAVEGSAKAREQAAQALRNADAAASAGRADELDKWNRAAQALAMQMQTSESLVESLKQQYTTASEQAELAKRQANENALHLQELTAKRMELVGKLEQAKMQEAVNRTMEQLNRPLDTSGPSVGEIEDKINARMAQASARAELQSSSIEGAQQELERSVNQIEAQARLDKLREELGLGPAPGAGAPALESGDASAASAAPAATSGAEDAASDPPAGS